MNILHGRPTMRYWKPGSLVEIAFAGPDDESSIRAMAEEPEVVVLLCGGSTTTSASQSGHSKKTKGANPRMAFPQLPVSISDQPRTGPAMQRFHAVLDSRGAATAYFVDKDLAEAFVYWTNHNVPGHVSASVTAPGALDRAYALMDSDLAAPPPHRHDAEVNDLT